MNTIHLVRYALLGALLFCSLITLALSASILSTLAAGEVPFTYLPLDLAIAIITMIVVIPSIVINFFRSGAFTSMVAVELGWTSVLMVLWIAAAGQTTATLNGISCVFRDDFTGAVVNGGQAESICHQGQALLGFTWLTFIIFLSWLITLITVASMAHTRGNPRVWTSPVTETDFLARNGPSYPQQREQAPVAYGQPMQQQVTGYSQSYPPQGYNTPPPQPTGYNPNVAHV